MRTLVFLLEELSAKVMLEGLLPRLGFPDDIHVQYLSFSGKSDLRKNIPLKLRGWKSSGPVAFVILHDKDSCDCCELKKEILRECAQAGRPETLVRIACTELESWYLGDLTAVERALGATGLAKMQDKAKFRTPDDIGNAAEELEKLTAKAETPYQKVGGSRAIGPLLNPEMNKSLSFRVFITGVRRTVSQLPSA